MNKNQKKLDKSLKLIVKSSVIVFVGLILAKIFTYLYRIIIARFFGPEVYGVFSLAIMVLGLFVALSSLGLFHGILRYISFYRAKNEKDKIRHIFRFSSFLILISSLFFSIILYFSSRSIAINFFHNSDLIIFLKIFSFLLPFYTFSDVFLSIIRAYEKIGWHSFILNILQNFSKLIILIIFVFFGMKTNSIIFSYSLAIIITLIASYLFCKYKLPEIFLKTKLEKKQKNKITKELLSYSWPIIFSTLMVTIFYWTDSFFIGYFKTAFEVGIYNAAVPIAVLLNFIPNLFIRLFFPLITKEYSKKNIMLIKELSKQVGKWIFLINIPLFIFFFFFSGTVIYFLFGEQYLIAELSLKILSIGILFSSIFALSPQLIYILGKSKVSLINMSLAFGLNIFLNFILISKEKIFFIENSLGINGAAIATTISIIFLNILFLFQTKHYLNFIPLRKKIIKIAIISLIPSILLICVRNLVIMNYLSLILSILCFFLIYALLIFLTGCLDKNDIMTLKAIRNKIFIKKT